MGLRFLNASTIQPKQDCRPKRSPSSATTTRQVTSYLLASMKSEYAKQDQPVCLQKCLQESLQEIQGWA